MFTHLNKLGDFELESQYHRWSQILHSSEWKEGPSITSITSFYNRQTFKNWREKVGEEQAIRSQRLPPTGELSFMIWLKSIF